MNITTGRRSLIIVAIGTLVGLFGVLLLTLGDGSGSAPAAVGAQDSVLDRASGPVGSVLRVDPESVYDPVRAGEETPRTYRQLLRRDQIEPVYDPSFTDVDSVDWPDDMLVIGVEGTVSSKAYPVTHLNSHEMVVDEIDGDPILVSW
jgi:hypothetical protein